MNKQELMENYTMEQLADMIIKYHDTFEVFKFSNTLQKTGLFDKPLIVAYETEIRIKNDRIEKLEKKIMQEKENMKCREYAIGGVLPTEPISFANRIIRYGADNHFNISEIRQIAEHLLVYCNANEEK